MKRQGTIAFVPSRYGADVVGGAETVMREQAHGLAERGWDVEVLTTCARDHYTWANEYPPGVEQAGAVTVRRFPAVVSTRRADRAALGGVGQLHREAAHPQAVLLGHPGRQDVLPREVVRRAGGEHLDVPAAGLQPLRHLAQDDLRAADEAGPEARGGEGERPATLDRPLAHPTTWNVGSMWTTPSWSEEL